MAYETHSVGGRSVAVLKTAADTPLTTPETEDTREDIEKKGEMIGKFDPASPPAGLPKVGAFDHFINTADNDALYYAPTAGAAVTAFVKAKASVPEVRVRKLNPDGSWDGSSFSTLTVSSGGALLTDGLQS